MQPILPGGEPKKQISFLYIRHLKIAETHAVLYFGRAGLKCALFCRKRQRQRQRRRQAAGVQQAFFRAIDDAAFQLGREGGRQDAFNINADRPGGDNRQRAAFAVADAAVPRRGPQGLALVANGRDLCLTDLPQRVNRGDTPREVLGLPLAGAVA